MNDIDRIMDILAQARTSIAKLGIDQWQYGYPTREIILDDIKKQRAFVLVDGGEIYATFALIFDGEITYNKIYAGAWLTNTPYLALHRIAIAIDKRGNGYSDAIMKFIFDTAREHSFASVRVDTHSGNNPMRRMIEKNGFEYCGIIHLIDGQQRVAYEKLL
jgi:GNAT superfamily N-acetyltransferase